MDYTLYNKLKEKFPPQPSAVIFVSLIPENLEKLQEVVFGIGEINQLLDLVGTHANSALPYAVIGGFLGEPVRFHFASREFVQEEDLVSGEIITSSIGIYHDSPVDIEGLKQEVLKFASGTLLLGNS